ncbi:hypothetical protein ACVWYG_000713 [Pedobacter sp. UYEF25]
MKNQEAFDKSAQAFADVLNNTITIKESRKLLKEVDLSLRRANKKLKLSIKWAKIANGRNELSTHVVDEEEIRCVPFSSISFYDGLDQFIDQNVTIGNVEYCVIWGND